MKGMGIGTAVTVCALTCATAPASADDAAVLRALSNLQARVASLEAKSGEDRHEIARLKVENARLRSRHIEKTRASLSATTLGQPLPPSAHARRAGAYIGASFGLGRDGTRLSDADRERQTYGLGNLSTVSVLHGKGTADTGALGSVSVHAGYDMLLSDRLLLGARVEGGLVEGGGGYKLVPTGIQTASAPGQPPTRTIIAGAFGETVSPYRKVKISSSEFAALKAGYLISDRTAAYGLLGWTEFTTSKFEAPVNFTNTTLPFSGDSSRSSGLLGGPTLGIGAETFLDDRWSVFGELRYTWLMSVSTKGNGIYRGSDFILSESGRAKLSGSFQFLRVGFSRHFD